MILLVKKNIKKLYLLTHIFIHFNTKNIHNYCTVKLNIGQLFKSSVSLKSITRQFKIVNIWY